MKKYVFCVEKYSTRKILGLGLGSWSRILKVSVSEGVVSVSKGQVLVSISADEAETPLLEWIPNRSSQYISEYAVSIHTN